MGVKFALSGTDLCVIPIHLALARGQVVPLRRIIVIQRAIDPVGVAFMDWAKPEIVERFRRKFFMVPRNEVFDKFNVLAGVREKVCELALGCSENAESRVIRSVYYLDVFHFDIRSPPTVSEWSFCDQGQATIDEAANGVIDGLY
jgi:hypothetical protein